MTEKQPLSLSPKYMTDSIAYWPLSRVVTLVREKEAENKGQRIEECHTTTRTAIRYLMPVIKKMSVQYGVTPSRMMRLISYHAVEILREDATARKIRELYLVTLDKKLEEGDLGLDVLRHSQIGYIPSHVEVLGKPTGVYLYDQFVKAEFDDAAESFSAGLNDTIFIYMLKSLLTDDIYKGAAEVFCQEVERWDAVMQLWVKFIENVVK